MEPDQRRARIRILLVLAVAGFAWWAIESWLAAFPWQSGDGYSLAATAILFVVIPVAIAVFLRRGGRTLLANPILLVPLGILMLARQCLALTTALKLMAAGSSFSVLNISIHLTVYFVLALILEVAYAAWVTRALLDQRDSGVVDLSHALRTWGRDIVRAALFMLVGQVVLLLGAGLIITAGVGVMYVLLVWGLVWNGLSVAFLPMALQAPTVGAGFRSAFSASRSKGLWGIVLLQQVLIGFVVYFSVSDVTVTRDGNTTHTNRWTRSGTYTTAVWTGGYESDFRWHDKLMADIVR